MPSTGAASVLKDLIDQRQWKAAFVHLQSNPASAAAHLSSGGLKPVDILPLHLACEAQAPPTVIRALLSANPDAVKAKGQRGYLPLHYACNSPYATEKVVSLLLTANPAAAAEKGDNGMLPLHLVCKAGASEDAVDAILAAHPEGLYVPNEDNRFPIDYVTSGRQKNKVAIFATLDRAGKYASIYKSAVNRTADTYESKLKAMRADHAAQVAELGRQRDEGKARTCALEEKLKKIDIAGERKKVKGLTEDLAKVRAVLAAERLEAKKADEGLRSELETVQTKATILSGELEESQGKVKNLIASKADLKGEADDLRAALEGSKVLLEQAKASRDASDDCTRKVERELLTAQSTNSKYASQNQRLRDMLSSLSGKVQSMTTEQEAVQDVFLAQGKELRAMAAANDELREHAERQADAMTRAMIDISDTVRFTCCDVEKHDETEDNDEEFDEEIAEMRSVSASYVEAPRSPPIKHVNLLAFEEKTTPETRSVSSLSVEDPMSPSIKHVNIPHLEEKSTLETRSITSSSVEDPGSPPIKNVNLPPVEEKATPEKLLSALAGEAPMPPPQSM